MNKEKQKKNTIAQNLTPFYPAVVVVVENFHSTHNFPYKRFLPSNFLCFQLFLDLKIMFFVTK